MGLGGSKESSATPAAPAPAPAPTAPAVANSAPAQIPKPPASTIPSNVRFEIKHIDVDGDGTPDKVQVIMKDGDKVTVREEPIQKVVQVIDYGIRNEQQALQNGAKVVTERVVYPDNAKPAEPKPVLIDELWIKQMQQEQQNFDKATSFGNYFKLGAGVSLGSVAVETIATGLLSLFTGDGGGKRRGSRKAKSNAKSNANKPNTNTKSKKATRKQ